MWTLKLCLHDSLAAFRSAITVPRIPLYSPNMLTTHILCNLLRKPCFLPWLSHNLHNTGNLKISRQLFFNIAGVISTDSWPFTRHFICRGSVNTANQGGHGFLVRQRRIRHVCRHFSVTVWKHDNRFSGHAFLYVRCARILMYIHKNLGVYRRIFAYTFCLINICLSLSDDANKIKTLNIERA